ncbi:TatD family deoxyribonuclease [Arsenicitalea aurantiaca]|uniref:TatD family deoxyribonuclease n=1 Tax=Arsenicitalea aurantiaca TaxID=1783274 RepID=A0A433XFP1_9HYPH|nr:TatD family hydrolase [Arsenicitalea aurantiaca]RUT32876.1 TatD family deoxyribonuclease [Arsenicitalea aurantiaca]
MLVDSHCHLDFEALSADLPAVLARAETAGVGAMVTICTRVKKFDTITAIADAYSQVWCSVGTHPHNADEELDIAAQDLIALSEHRKCVAIGEAGLDYFYDNAPREAQAEGLRRHIVAARETGLPLVIHSRAADDDMVRILQQSAEEGAFPFVLHCFTAGPELARVGLELGGYISFSGIITFKNAEEIRAIAREVPGDRILVETDAPYLAPIPHRGEANEPAYTRHAAEKLAEIRGVSFGQLADQTTANFARLFSKTGMA